MPPLQFETVSIPVTKGLDLSSAARLVEPPGLLEAKNARFSGDGSSKRYGHTEYRARSGAYPGDVSRRAISAPNLTNYGAKIVDSDWLYGWGAMEERADSPTSGTGSIYALSPYPEPGMLLGGFERDSELVAWTGHSLLSYSPSQNFTQTASLITPACIPALNAVPIAKSRASQNYPDGADNGKIRIVVWSSSSDDDIGTNADIYFSAYDSITEAPIVVDQVIVALNDPYYTRIISLGEYFHIFAIDRSGGQLTITTLNSNNLTLQTTINVATCTKYYDVWKLDETKAVIITNDDTNLTVSWIDETGNPADDETQVQLGLIAVAPEDPPEVPLEVTICTHPTTGRLGVGFISTAASHTANTIFGGIYNRSGTKASLTALQATGSVTTGFNRISVAPKYLISDPDSAIRSEVMELYSSVVDTSVTPALETRVLTSFFRYDVNGTRLSTAAFNLRLASRAFSVGDRTFVWASKSSLLQSTWFLIDEQLKPIGHLDFGIAQVQPLFGDYLPTLASVNFSGTEGAKDRFVYHLALGYKQRVQTSDEQQGLYTEPSIHFIKLDFLPTLRAIQAGRSAYIAGAQVWSYDGHELTEAGFHLAPEFLLAQSNGGALTALGTYSYRVDLCYRNAQNEEIRSHSYISQITLTGTNKTVTLTIKPSLTRRNNAYILIFRTSMFAGAPTSTWNLLNSRDPEDSTYRLNQQTVETITFADAGATADAIVLTRELHPGNSSTYQHPFAAPACEVISAGRDRVWLAGGELEAGQIAPSRLFGVGETPAWNGNIAIQIDRNEAPITGIGFVGDIAAIFRDRLTYIQEGDGPDNQANGFWPPARLALADTGAVSQESIILCASGLLFQSPAGFRLLGPGGQLSNMGQMVDPLVQDFKVMDAVSVAKDSEVRWYGPAGVIVYNYLRDAWSTWTCGAMAALRGSRSTRVTLIRSSGHFWVETEGLYRDGPAPYEHLIRFPWLHAGNLQDFQRLRRFSAFGTHDIEQPHKVEVKIYYDERDHPEETWVWDVPDSTQNTSTWGSGTWGSGFWGDSSGTLLRARDSVWRWRRRPRKQKCAVFSLSISDHNTDGPGFSLVGIGLELAKKTGLDRIPALGNTSTFKQ